MKINRKSLTAAVKIASKVAKEGGNFPILSCVVLDGAGQKLIATDLEMAVKIPLEISDYGRTMPAEGIDGVIGEDGIDGLKGPQLKQLAEDYGISFPGKATVPAMRTVILEACENASTEESSWNEKFCISAKDLGKILSSLTDEEVEITRTGDEDGLLFKTGAPRVRIGQNFTGLATFDVDEFPSFDEEVGHDTTINITKKNLVNVSMAAQKKDDQGFNLKGIYFDLEDRENLAAVATDGHRLHWSSLDAENIVSPEGLGGFTCPIDAVKMFKALFADEDLIHIQMNSAGHMISVPFGEKGGMLYIRAMESRFPAWKVVVPSEPEKSLTILKADMETPLQQAMTITGEKYSSIKLKFNGGIDVDFTNPEKGEYQKISIPVKSKNYPDGEEVTFGFNGQFILDAMKPIESEDLHIMFDTGNKPIVMGFESYHALVMPMRV
jgi:DNA polymerase-3 subunit beta